MIVRTELRKALGSVLDLERLLAKITLGTAGPRELHSLGKSLAKLPEIAKLAAQVEHLHLGEKTSMNSGTFARGF